MTRRDEFPERSIDESSLSDESPRASSTKICAQCGGSLDATERTPAATSRGDDGDVSVYLFCDEECRNAWKSE